MRDKLIFVAAVLLGVIFLTGIFPLLYMVGVVE